MITTIEVNELWQLHAVCDELGKVGIVYQTFFSDAPADMYLWHELERVLIIRRKNVEVHLLLQNSEEVGAWATWIGSRYSATYNNSS